VQGGELVGSAAANAVRGHLALLGRAYWRDVHDLADDLIAHPAIYPPARAVLEHSAEIVWVLDPALDPDMRAQRAAALLLWSQAQRRRPEAGIHEHVQNAGFEVRMTKRGEQYVLTDAGSGPLTITRMIETAHGRAGVDLYRRWSPDAHPDPLTLMKGITLRPDRTGYHVGGLVREDRDVEVAIEVSDLVASTAERVAAYFGRSATPAERCREVAAELREFLPVVATAVAQRNAHAFDPT
jgi:hypothetical protein